MASVAGSLFIDGSPSFRSQISAALLYWDQADPSYAPRMLACINSIVQHNDNLETYLTPEGNLYISENIVFWPGVGQELQQRIAASYLAHEGAHAYLLCHQNEHWNDEKGEIGEELALKYQECVAQCLKVPDKYIAHPIPTMMEEVQSKPYLSFSLRQHEEWVPVAGMALIAVGANVLAGMFRKREHATIFKKR